MSDLRPSGRRSVCGWRRKRPWSWGFTNDDSPSTLLGSLARSGSGSYLLTRLERRCVSNSGSKQAGRLSPRCRRVFAVSRRACIQEKEHGWGFIQQQPVKSSHSDLKFRQRGLHLYYAAHCSGGLRINLEDLSIFNTLQASFTHTRYCT